MINLDFQYILVLISSPLSIIESTSLENIKALISFVRSSVILGLTATYMYQILPLPEATHFPADFMARFKIPYSFMPILPASSSVVEATSEVFVLAIFDGEDLNDTRNSIKLRG